MDVQYIGGITVYHQCEIKVVCQVIWFVSFPISQLGWIYLFKIIQELLVIKNNQIINISIAWIKWPASLLWLLLIILSKKIHSHMSKGKGQWVTDHSSFLLKFQLPDGKDILQTVQRRCQCKASIILQKLSAAYILSSPPLSLPPKLSFVSSWFFEVHNSDNFCLVHNNWIK